MQSQGSICRLRSAQRLSPTKLPLLQFPERPASLDLLCSSQWSFWHCCSAFAVFFNSRLCKSTLAATWARHSRNVTSASRDQWGKSSWNGSSKACLKKSSHEVAGGLLAPFMSGAEMYASICCHLSIHSWHCWSFSSLNSSFSWRDCSISSRCFFACSSFSVVLSTKLLPKSSGGGLG